MQFAMSRTPVLVAAALLIAAPIVLCATAAVIDRSAQKAALEEFVSGSANGFSVTQIHADPARRAWLIDGLVLHAPDLALRIGHLSLPWPAPEPRFAAHGFLQTAAAADTGANPAQSSTITADDVSIEAGQIRIAIKNMELNGTSLSKASLDALFAAHVAVGERLAQISAAHVAIAEMLIETKSDAKITAMPPTPDGQAAPKDTPPNPPQTEKITLRDIALDDLVQGHVRQATVSATSLIMKSADAGEMLAALGPTRLSGVDLVQAVALLSPPAADTAARKQNLCDSMAIEGVKIEAPQTRAELGIGTVAIKDVKLRPLRSPSGPGSSGATDTNHSERAVAFAQAFDHFNIAVVDFTDLRFGASSGANSWTGRIGHGVLNQMIEAKVGDAQFETFSVTGEGATVKIKRLAWHAINHPSAAVPKVAPDTAAAPDQDKMTAELIDIDFTNLTSLQGQGGLPPHVQLGHVEVTSGDPVDGVPTRMRAALDHLIFDLKDMKDNNFAKIAALGYGRLDLSSRLEAHFDTAKREFDLDALSLHGTDMGAVRISGQFDQVTNGLLSSDQAEMEAALVRVLLRKIEIKVENAGLFERLVAAAAKNAGVSQADIRKEFTDSVTRNVPALLANGRGADELAAAITKFIAQPKTFQLAVTAPDGIGVLDLVLIKNPASLLQRLDIKAAADE
jgi:hypothetical protein